MGPSTSLTTNHGRATTDMNAWDEKKDCSIVGEQPEGKKALLRFAQKRLTLKSRTTKQNMERV